ncbi:unnamed protein product [Effrenium voratum]|nr:unnamed protein product [Effrenium voratum]
MLHTGHKMAAHGSSLVESSQGCSDRLSEGQSPSQKLAPTQRILHSLLRRGCSQAFPRSLPARNLPRGNASSKKASRSCQTCHSWSLALQGSKGRLFGQAASESAWEKLEAMEVDGLAQQLRAIIEAEVAARSAELDRRERELKAREEAVQRREQALDLPTFPERGVAAETPTPSRAPCALFQACTCQQPSI